jgi:hypothetical protein
VPKAKAAGARLDALGPIGRQVAKRLINDLASYCRGG